MGARQKILSVVGTRPNFMKVAPIVGALERRGEEFEHVLVHTGQHYDAEMSEIFLEELGVGAPDHCLDVGSGTHALQTARVMERLEPVLLAERADVVLVPGDVNSTLAASLVSVKLGLSVAHIEAGLRSFDRTMPEEINRVVTDAVSEKLFIHSPEARGHLLAEGREERMIHYVGNTMIDTLMRMRERIEALDAPGGYGLHPGEYLVVTLHRPALVDGPLLRVCAEALRGLAAEMRIVFPVHPRTRARLTAEAPELEEAAGVTMLQPIGYLEFLGLVSRSGGVLTDSGGVQKEAYLAGVPCVTMRANTEWTETVENGWNALVDLDVDAALAALQREPPPDRPELYGDGHAGQRVVDVLSVLQR